MSLLKVWQESWSTRRRPPLCTRWCSPACSQVLPSILGASSASLRTRWRCPRGCRERGVACPLSRAAFLWLWWPPEHTKLPSVQISISTEHWRQKAAVWQKSQIDLNVRKCSLLNYEPLEIKEIVVKTFLVTNHKVINFYPKMAAIWPTLLVPLRYC